MELTAEEIRVLGVLVEKEATTPDQYPLSTNALTNACNQKTSRDPVVSYDQRTVSETMLLLRPAGLARTIVSGRTEKHRHVLHEAWNLDNAQLAVLAVLMLRGAQSPGELRTRTERAHGFDGLDEVQGVLDSLAARDEPLVRNVGRAPGQSQDRWIHLLGSDDPGPSLAPTAPVPTNAVPTNAVPTNAVPAGPTSVARPAAVSPASVSPASVSPASVVADLEARVAELEARMAMLEAELGL